MEISTRRYLLHALGILATCAFALPGVCQSFPAGRVSLREEKVTAEERKETNAGRQFAFSKSSVKSCTDYHWFPLYHKSCNSDDQINAFFVTNGKYSGAEAAQYEYNVAQSASVVNADLMTANFAPGYQLVLAGSANSGSNGNSTTTTTSGSSTMTTDSAATAISKLQAGGDFNLRGAVPVYSKASGGWAAYGQLTPNLGFTINGLSATNTITQGTDTAFNLPLEFYGQSSATKSSPSAAVVFADGKLAAEFIGAALAQKLGPSVPRTMFLAQASAGVEFAQKVRISAQWVYGNASIYQSASTTTSTTTPAPTTKIGGFHFVISFSK